VKVRPKDKDAKLKWTECNKIVKKMAFEKAIAVDDCKKSIADTIDIGAIGKFSTQHLNQPFYVHVNNSIMTVSICVVKSSDLK